MNNPYLTYEKPNGFSLGSRTSDSVKPTGFPLGSSSVCFSEPKNNLNQTPEKPKAPSQEEGFHGAVVSTTVVREPGCDDETLPSGRIAAALDFDLRPYQAEAIQSLRAGLGRSPADRMLDNIEIITETGCWIFMGALSEGYGIVSSEGPRGTAPERAHRLSYQHFNGPVPKGLFVCHRCDIRCCCNPHHLFLGTQHVHAAPRPEKTIDVLCNLIVFTDYHLGQLSWGRETGADWDLGIAERLLLASFVHMVEAAPQAKSCVLALQGDFLHTDGLLPLTPAHQNVLDADGRFSKIVAAAIRVIRRLVDHALIKHESVHLVICEGNHDEASSVWLRQMFTALYENEPRLTVNDSELPFYVHQHGEVMLAFHHGHKVTNEQLPMLFAAQFPKIWGNTVKRYAHCGHRHHVDEKEYAGMTVTQHPTLAARDAHSARGGWISERAAVLVTYHEKFGQVARTIICPEMFAETT